MPFETACSDKSNKLSGVKGYPSIVGTENQVVIEYSVIVQDSVGVED